MDLREAIGANALIEISKKKSILANSVGPFIEKAVVDMAVEFPAYGYSLESRMG